MTLDEKIKLINENKERNCLYISPKTIRGGARLAFDYETIELYENMEGNTIKFAERIIVDVRSKTNIKNHMRLYLIFNGNFDDLPENLGDFEQFIKEYKNKIIALHQYIKETETREFFVGFLQTEKINKYGYIYLNFAKLLSILEENNIEWKINTKEDYISSIYKDDNITKFELIHVSK